MAPNDKAGRVVFIGNIPYGGTEELIIDTLSRVGQVLNFRLVYDKETGRPKGFGFAEFADADAAASAVRNLNDYEVMGRKLRVDWSNDNGAGDAAPPSYSAPPMPTNGQPEPAPASSSGPLPQLPPGAALEPGLTCPDSISRTLSALPAPQLLEILSQMKGLVTTDPAKATELLRQAPQLAYAIFQCLLLLNLVDTTNIGQFIDSGNTATQATAPPPQHTPVPQPPRSFPAYPPPIPTAPPAHVPSMPYGAPPPAQAAPPLDPQQAQMYQLILTMPPEQLEALPPDDRAKVLQLRQTILQGGIPQLAR
ncbi:hypothetical protein BCR34DRAFT_549832 [Clohesyomyces aquaticus]|uniref:RRM domain-containing protein n=1 Tax=Clohesyomyces aquaticus TaxID=1231657 RepID=A0A1Y1YBD1_9PLEO|nr:hypothetical protein BCR34DRAFT_549832 [Clohesyomyces aquaticus]